MRILRLNKAGDPLGWITQNQAAELYSKDQVVWELGEKKITLHGGVNSYGIQSRLSLSPIIACEGRVVSDKLSISLSNSALFRRDMNLCMYCGNEFVDSLLTREHIIPRGQGGPDVWTNVVAACKSCNGRKACRTPEEAGMQLLATPFKPNPFEWVYLMNRNIIFDQMEYLKTRFNNDRTWAN